MSSEASSRGGAYGAVHAGQITVVINNWLFFPFLIFLSTP